MPAGNHQCQQREFKIRHKRIGINMAGNMMHRNQRLVKGEGDCLGSHDTDMKTADQSRPEGIRDRINFLHCAPRFPKCFRHNSRDILNMYPAGNLRHNSAVQCMRVDL